MIKNVFGIDCERLVCQRPQCVSCSKLISPNASMPLEPWMYDTGEMVVLIRSYKRRCEIGQYVAWAMRTPTEMMTLRRSCIELLVVYLVVRLLETLTTLVGATMNFFEGYGVVPEKFGSTLGRPVNLHMVVLSATS